jgi:ATP-binding cassette subfamily B protein
LIDTPPDWSDSETARPLPAVRGEVTFERVTFAYQPGRPVLHDVDFQISPGRTVALVGHTGSGKTTIIGLLARFYLAQEGRVLIDGHDLREVTGDSLHHQMGLVLQQNFLVTGTVRENIRVGRPGATDAEIAEAARQLDCLDLFEKLSEGFDTVVGERGAKLSLGQRQLVCFTRAMLADPRILILDEATSAIDTLTELRIQRALTRLLAGRTSFVVAHRLSTIRHADVVLVLDQGRLVERGTHDELLALGGKYSELCRSFIEKPSDLSTDDRPPTASAAGC